MKHLLQGLAIGEKSGWWGPHWRKASPSQHSHQHVSESSLLTKPTKAPARVCEVVLKRRRLATGPPKWVHGCACAPTRLAFPAWWGVPRVPGLSRIPPAPRTAPHTCRDLINDLSLCDSLTQEGGQSRKTKENA